MKLGISYPVFDGVELLEYAIKSIRSEVHFVAVIRQETSYYGNKAKPELKEKIHRLKDIGLVDEVLLFHPDLTAPRHHFNEVKARNLGLGAGKAQGCTHHISFDVDEFCTPEQLRFAKEEMEKGNHDCSAVEQVVYLKHPTYRIKPDMGYKVSFIMRTDLRYDLDGPFPFIIESTKRPSRCENIRVFTREEFELHHMSYVRLNIREKTANNANHTFDNQKKFLAAFDKYTLGDLIALPPDHRNRRTVLAPDLFNIGAAWEQLQQQA